MWLLSPQIDLRKSCASMRTPCVPIAPPSELPQSGFRVLLTLPSRRSVREDFADTVFWSSGVVTNSDGVAEIRFALSDSITSFHVMADAHAVGRPGFGIADKFIGARVR